MNKIAIVGKLDNDWGLEGIIKQNLAEFNQNRGKDGKPILDIFDLAFFNDNEAPRYFDNIGIYEAVVFIQGRNIRKEHFWKIKGKRILWNAEFWSYKGFEDNQDAMMRLHLAEPLQSYDLILNGCPLSTEYLKATRKLPIEWFPMMGVDPEIHNKICVEKETDIGFYGVPSNRRVEIWNQIPGLIRNFAERSMRIQWKQVWGEDLIRFINSCKVVLNIHYSELLNTESRIYEILACGGICISEPISFPTLFLDGVHFISTSTEDLAAKAVKIANRVPDRVKEVAESGYKYVHNRFNIQKVLSQLVDRIKQL